MILRPPTYADVDWITEAYRDWPKGRPNVDNLLRRWIERGDPVCLIGAEDTTNFPIALVTYRQQFFGVWIHNLVVHPMYRKQGHSKTMLNLLKDKLVSEGAMVASFKPLPGAYEWKYANNTFYWDMDI